MSATVTRRITAHGGRLFRAFRKWIDRRKISSPLINFTQWMNYWSLMMINFFPALFSQRREAGYEIDGGDFTIKTGVKRDSAGNLVGTYDMTPGSYCRVKRVNFVQVSLSSSLVSCIYFINFIRILPLSILLYVIG